MIYFAWIEKGVKREVFFILWIDNRYQFNVLWLKTKTSINE